MNDQQGAHFRKQTKLIVYDLGKAWFLHFTWDKVLCAHTNHEKIIHFKLHRKYFDW